MKKLYFLLILSILSISYAQGQSNQPATLPYTQTFEDNDPDRGNWVLQNGSQPNHFIFGQPSGSTTGKALMITHDGSTNSYLWQESGATVADYSTVWAWRDIQFPSTSEAGFLLTLTWRCNAEPDYDFGELYIGDATDVTNFDRHESSPDWVDVGTGNYVPNGLVRLARFEGKSLAQSAAYFIPANGVAGTTKRLYILWTNDSLSGNEPPLYIDDISITVPQFASVSGSVLCNNPNQTIPGATISFVSPNGLTYNTTANGNGTYAISDLVAGFYNVTVKAIGFETLVTSLTLTEGTNQQPLALTASPCSLTPTGVDYRYNSRDGSISFSWLPIANDVLTQASNSDFSGQLGVNAPSYQMEPYHLFRPSHLAAYHGGIINRVSFMFHSSPDYCTYTIRIWKGGTGEIADGPQTLLYERTIDASDITALDTWLTFEIDPIVIDSTQCLWIGYQARWQNAPEDGSRYPCALVNSNNTGLGNVLFFNNTWQHTGDYNDWAISAFVTAPVQSYNFLTNGSVEATGIDAPTYTVTNPQANACYQVSAICDNGVISAATECVRPVFQPIVTTDSVTGPTYYYGIKLYAAYGTVVDDGHCDGTRGICYSTSPTPTLANSVVSATNIKGAYGLYVTNLSENSTYYFRAFVATALDTVYGDVLSLTVPCSEHRTDFYETVCDQYSPGSNSTLLQESFENGSLPSGWTTLDRDNDGFNWEIRSTHYVNSGNKCISSASYDEESDAGLSPENWLITPPVSIPANGNTTLSWWASAQDLEYFEEHYEVHVFPSLDAVSSSATPLFEETLTSGGQYSNHTISLNSYAGQTVYIAFVHNECEEMFYLNLDDIVVEHQAAAVTYTESGEYSDTLTSINGCDSIVTLHLTVLHNLASVATSGVSDITTTTANVSGLVEIDCGSAVTETGFCYSTSPNPTTAGAHTVVGTGMGDFSATLTGLASNTTYYVRAYAVNSAGTAYGNEISFSTLASCNISGLVTDNSNNTPISGATLVIANNNTSYTTTTNNNGLYALYDLPTGDYTISIYAAGYSAQSLQQSLMAGSNTVTFSLEPAPCAKVPTDLTYEEIDGQLQLSWHIPADTLSKTYSQNSINVYIGNGSSYTFGCYHLFTPAELANFHGETLSSIGAVLGGDINYCSYTLKVFTGGDEWNGPESATPAYMQNISNNQINPGVWNDFALSTPYVIDASRNLWVGYEITCYNPNGEAVYTAGATDNGNIIDRFGNVVYLNGWSTLSEISNGNLNYNWLIRATIDGVTPTFTVLENGSTLATNVQGTTYMVSPYNTESCYQVVSTCWNGIQSEPSACATIIQQMPEVTTDSVINITGNSAVVVGTVTFDGNSTITDRGICWSENSNPTLDDYVVSAGSGSGSFTAVMTNLSLETTYYVRTYATNNKGTSYGDILTFSTLHPCNPVTTINVQDILGTSAFITWNASENVPTTYEFSYKSENASDWIVVPNIENEYLMLSGLQTQTTYQVRLSSHCLNGSPSDYTETTFTTGCLFEKPSVTIAPNQYSSSSFPFVSCYPYSYTQQIFKASEIGEARTIDRILFQYFYLDTITRNLTIYLGHTTQDGFNNSSSWIPVSSLQQVYSGYITFSNSNLDDYWFNIPLTTPFEYDGVQNLVLVIDDNTGVESCNSMFYAHYTENTSSYLFYYYDDINPTELSTQSSNFYYYRDNERCNIMFPGTCLNIGCDRSNLAVKDVTDTSALILFAAGSGSTGVELQYRNLNSSDYTTISTSAGSPILLTGLMMNTDYEVRIRTLCGDDQSGWKNVTFTTNVPNWNRLYVTTDGTGLGSSWGEATNDLNWAVATAKRIGEEHGITPDVWVAQGVYYGAPTDNNAFYVQEGVNVYGGFEGNEPDNFDLSQRDFSAHATILDGQNTHRVLLQEDHFNIQTLWDGFTIRNGNPVSESQYDSYGGGAYLRNNTCLRNCTFTNNTAYYGGGAYSVRSDNNRVLVFDHCVFIGNNAYYGGGAYPNYSIINNCLFADNTASYGGGLYTNSAITVESSTFANNRVTENYPSLYAYSSSYSYWTSSYTRLYNCVLWGNLLNDEPETFNLYFYIYNCAADMEITTTNNSNAVIIPLSHDNFGNNPDENYPHFAAPLINDYRLRAGSALTNAGNNSDANATTDLAGGVRIYDGTLDIGCYEFHGEEYCTPPAVTATDITASSAMILWDNSNPSEPTKYEFSYRPANTTDWTVVDNITESHFMLSGLQPQSEYSVRLRAYCDSETSSDYSSIVTFTTGCPGGSSSILTLESTNEYTCGYLPIYAYYGKSYSQQIYYASEIGGERAIDTIYLQYTSNNILTRDIDIYLGHTSKTAFESSSDWIHPDQLTLVKSDSITFTNTGTDYWFAIPLDTTFIYNGIDNLVLVFEDHTPSYYTSSNFKSYTTNTNVYRSMYYSGYSTDFNINSHTGSRSEYVNILRLPAYCFNDECDRANISVTEVTDSSALLVTAAGTGALNIELEYAEVGSDHYTLLSTTEGEYRLTGLRQNTSYRVRVRSVCSTTELSRWKMTSFTTCTKVLDHLYVTADGTGDASSWDNASGDLAWTLDLARTIIEEHGIEPVIWMAEGVYYGDSISTNAFQLVEGVNIYGGFAGNEPVTFDLSQRDLTTHVTILDGQRNQRVLYQSKNFTKQTILDGLTIRNGYAAYNYNSDKDGNGGGAYLRQHTSVHNCVFTRNKSYNSGGALYISNNPTYDTISNCVFSHNYSRNNGGAIYGSNVDLISDCVFEYDTATSNGGALYLTNSTLRNSSITHSYAPYGGGIYSSGNVQIRHCAITYNNSSQGGGIYINTGYNGISNCLISNNSAVSYGGGIYKASYYADTITNTTIVRNNVTQNNSFGAGVCISSGTQLITNSILWGNEANGVPSALYNYNNNGSLSLSHTAMDDVTAGTNIMPLLSESFANGSYMPHFANPSVMAGCKDTTSLVDWHLLQGSPCINHGVFTTEAFDLDGHARVQQDTTDLGCYESAFNSIPLPEYGNIIYVKQGGAGTQDGSSWDNATGSLQDAMVLATAFDADVWVAAGIYLGDGISENAFTLLPGINVYGGFEGTEPETYDLSQRDFSAHASILDGQSSQRVLRQPFAFTESTASVFDGFTLQNGRVAGNGAGAYILAYSTLRNCTIRNNICNATETCYGAGVYAYGYDNNAYYTPHTFISHCTISNNQSDGANASTYLYGGGLHANYTEVDHTEISYNISGNNGGGVYLNSYSSLYNCLIHNNTSSRRGGGVYSSSSSSSSYPNKIINCSILSNNTTSIGSNGNGAGLYFSYGQITNCLIWGNRQNQTVNNIYGNSGTLNYCAIEGGWDGTNNITLASSNDGADRSLYYPRFIDPENLNFQLHPSSACINIGQNDVVTDTLDFYGNTRIVQSTVDIGCSEAQSENNCMSVINLTVDNITTNSARLTWQPRGIESAWYVVYGEVDGTQNTILVQNDTTCIITGLQLNRSYTAKVQSYCGDDSYSIFSIPVNFATECNPSDFPPLPDFSDMRPENNAIIYNYTLNNVQGSNPIHTDYKVDFSWNAMSDATSYDFYIWESTESEPTTPLRTGLTSATVTNIQLSQNTPGKIYYWKVVAWNECLSKTSPVMTLTLNKATDLHVTGLTCSTPMAGRDLTVEWTVRNDGEGNTPPGATWNDYIWISDVDGVGSGFWYNVDETLLGTVPNVRSLNAGEEYHNSATVTLPEGKTGNYYLFIFSWIESIYNINFTPTGQGTAPDPYTPSITGNPYYYMSGTARGSGRYNINETAVGDNFFYKVINILPPPSPDLRVTSIVPPMNAYSGTRVPIRWTVTNTGEADASGSWTDVVYLSPDTTLNTATALRIGRYPHSGTLQMDSSYICTEEAEIPVDYNGNYYFFVETDMNDNIYEGVGESNNISMSEAMSVTLTPPANLVVSSATIPTIVSPNEELTCYYSVTNQGMSATYGNNWFDALYISTEATFNRNHSRPISNVHHTHALDRDESYNDSMYVRIPLGFSGNCYLHLVTDNNNDVFEYTYEDDNTFTIPITINLPDLEVTSIRLDNGTDVQSGDIVRLQWIVRNNGPGNIVNRTFADRFDINGEEVYTANVRTVNIAVGDSIVRSASILIPCLNNSRSALSIKTDFEDFIEEADSSNNTQTINLTIHQPDLTISNVSVPNEGWSGTNITVNYDVENVGTGNCSHPNITDKFYCSTSPNSFLESDLIGQHTHQIQIGVGESATYSANMTLPNGVQGTYYIHVVTNVGDSLCEGSNTASNSRASNGMAIQLSPWPDIVVQRLTVPNEVYLGAGFPITYTLRNDGVADLNNAPSMQKFYFSMSPSYYDTNNIIASNLEFLTIASGDSAVFSATLTLPARLAPSTFYIHMMADGNNQVYEHTAENNNHKVSAPFSASPYALDIVAVEIIGPDVVQWGETVTYRMRVTNNSNVPTIVSTWVDALFLSEDQFLQNSDEVLASSRQLMTLNPGQEYTVYFNSTIPYGTPSNVFLLGYTDYFFDNPDINHINNTIIKPITVNSVPTPDLALTNAVKVDAVFSGQPTRIAYTVTNVSSIPISSQCWNTKIFLSGNNTYETSDIELLFNNSSHCYILPNESYTDTVTVTVPLPNYGDLNLLVIVNPSNNPYELNTDNNLFVLPVTVTLPPPGDLVVRDINSESSIVSGQMMHISWKVRNIGDNILRGNGLRTLVYVSTDTLFDINDRLIGNITTNGVNLGIDQSLSQSLNTRLNGLPAGDYYLIIHTDVTNAFNEDNDNNNSAHSQLPFTVTIRQLPFNTDVADTLYNNEISDFIMDVGDHTSQTVRIHVASEDSLNGAMNMIYATHNALGNNLNYSYSTIGQYTGNPELYIPATLPGYYGVNVYGSTPLDSVQNMVIRADILPFELRGVDDNQGGNTGTVTVRLTGSRFRPDMKVSLVRGSEVITPDTLIYVNFYEAYASFDLTGRAPGLCDVRAVNPCEGESVLTNGFNIIEGMPGEIGYNLIFPSAPRPNRSIVMTLEFGNTGNVDIHDAVLILTSHGDTPIALTSEEVSQNRKTLRIPLSIPGEPQGLLRPGVTGSINIYAFSSGALLFSIKPVYE